jgi:hypothetical protein
VCLRYVNIFLETPKNVPILHPAQVYPLAGRGLRVVSGRNDDDHASSSNGAGGAHPTCTPSIPYLHPLQCT